MKTTCPNCEGFGMIYTTDPVKYDTEALRCRACDGVGYIYTPEEKRMDAPKIDRIEALWTQANRKLTYVIVGPANPFSNPGEWFGLAHLSKEDAWNEYVGLAVALLKAKPNPKSELLMAGMDAVMSGHTGHVFIPALPFIDARERYRAARKAAAVERRLVSRVWEKAGLRPEQLDLGMEFVGAHILANELVIGGPGVLRTDPALILTRHARQFAKVLQEALA